MPLRVSAYRPQRLIIHGTFFVYKAFFSSEASLSRSIFGKSNSILHDRKCGSGAAGV